MKKSFKFEYFISSANHFYRRIYLKVIILEWRSGAKGKANFQKFHGYWCNLNYEHPECFPGRGPVLVEIGEGIREDHSL